MDVETEHGQPEPPGGTTDDAGLVARVVAGDRSAYDPLVERYQRRAFAVAYRLLGSRDDALEVCQDAFLRGYRALATLQEPARFGAWLLRIVGNVSLNYRRARRRRASPLATGDEPGVDLDDAEMRAPAGRRPPARPEDSAVAGELNEQVHVAMERLPEKQRIALTLFSINGMSQKEVAEILDCSVEVVKWSVFQARKTLKAALKEYL